MYEITGIRFVPERFGEPVSPASSKSVPVHDYCDTYSEAMKIVQRWQVGGRVAQKVDYRWPHPDLPSGDAAVTVWPAKPPLWWRREVLAEEQSKNK